MQFRQAFDDVRAALRGEPRDYTSGPLPRAVLLLAIPMVIEMSMQAIFSVVDIWFVGKLGADAVAVVGLSDSLLGIVFAVSIGLSMGTTAMVARRIGEKNEDAAAVAAVQAILIGVVLAAISGLAAVFGGFHLLRAMGAEPELARYGSGFAAILLGGNVTVMLLFLINAAFRGAGDAAIAMRALTLANGLNIVLDPILIFGWGPIPAFGLEGAAIATTLARAVGVAYQIRELGRSGSRLQIGLRHLKLDLGVMRRLVRVSTIGIVQFMVSTSSFILLMRIVAGFGPVAMAGYTIAIRVIIFVLLPVWGMGNAAATLVGQSLGAGKPERAEAAVWLTARWNAVVLGAVTVLFFLAATPLVAPFSSDAEAVRLAAQCLRTVALSYVFWGFGMVTVLAFNGAGDTTTPTWINLAAYWVLQLPLAWALAHPGGMGPRGVFWAITIAQAAAAAIGILWFRAGKWKQRTI